MSASLAFRLSAGLGFLAVALGAFGAHGLESVLRENARIDTWETATFYHLTHALALWALASREPFLQGAWWCFFAGILVFSGSLYVLSVTNMTVLGAITPFGGLALLAGWAWLVWKGCRRSS